MARVKGGYTTRQRRKKVIKLAKGYYGAKHILYKTAHEQVCLLYTSVWGLYPLCESVWFRRSW